MASDFRLIEDAPFVLPSLLGLVAELPIDVFGLSTFLRQPPSGTHGRLDQAVQHRIGTHHIMHTFWRPSRFAIVGIRSLDRLFVFLSGRGTDTAMENIYSVNYRIVHHAPFQLGCSAPSPPHFPWVHPPSPLRRSASSAIS